MLALTRSQGHRVLDRPFSRHAQSCCRERMYPFRLEGAW